jgi:hypothetical protein
MVKPCVAGVPRVLGRRGELAGAGCAEAVSFNRHLCFHLNYRMVSTLTLTLTLTLILTLTLTFVFCYFSFCYRVAAGL